MKRFWTDVSTRASGEGWDVWLDERPVRTPGRAALTLPTPMLAGAVADEWRAVGETLDPRSMMLTGLANAAIDRIASDRAGFARGLAPYGGSDLLCYRAAEPPELRDRQDALWDPPLAWAQARYDVRFTLATGVMPIAQPAATQARLGDALMARTAWELAGLSPLVTISGSLVLALAVAERALAADDAWTAADLDEAWQAEKWGEDALAAEARENRRRDFTAAARFLDLLRPAGD